MKIKYINYHLNAKEIAGPLLMEVENAISSIDVSACRTKISKEASSKGATLISPKDLNRCFENSLQAQGWAERTETFYTSVCPDTTISVRGKPAEEQKYLIESKGLKPYFRKFQTDFLKDEVAIEVQFGKYAFVGHDFDKFTSLYARGLIKVGIEIVVTPETLREMSSGVASYNHVITSYTERRDFLQVPLVMIGIEP